MSANNEVKAVMNAPSTTKKRIRGTYDRFTPEEKAIIARRAIQNGITKTVMKYINTLQDRKLKESTIHTWITKYKRQLELRRCTGIEVAANITRLEQKRRERPLLLGEELDRYTREYIAELRRNGGIINTENVSSAAMGIVKKFDAYLLGSDGGHISCNREWAKGLLNRMGYVNSNIFLLLC